jgi:hypothetical protein
MVFETDVLGIYVGGEGIAAVGGGGVEYWLWSVSEPRVGRDGEVRTLLILKISDQRSRRNSVIET